MRASDLAAPRRRGAAVDSSKTACSHRFEALLHPLAPKITSIRAQLVLLVTTVTVLSAFVKNIGALAMMLPVAFQMAKRSKTSPSDGVATDALMCAQEQLVTKENPCTRPSRSTTGSMTIVPQNALPSGLRRHASRVMRPSMTAARKSR